MNVPPELGFFPSLIRLYFYVQVPSKPRLEPLMVDVIEHVEPEEYGIGESDDEIGDNEEPKGTVSNTVISFKM